MQQINFGNIDDDCVGPTIGDLEECRSARWLIGRCGADAFDAIKIGGMMFVNDGIVKPCTEPDDVPAFYSVYLHYANRPGRSPDCVGDFATVERARAYAAQIHDAFGWPIAIDRTPA
ncbi:MULTISPECIES: hypothetical protein [Burkholderia]|uniref:hypothetical protein n=1 Tax=Burkholderia TaxID=32008 RepID=UPI001AA04871|nr:MULTISPECIES: hypothetical protein [Burkholderia]MBU9489969.1 hypothetical protein [Burkholderia multivorans]QTD88337.1 hypothetical protein J4G50_10900 [Burkholderia anthina]HEM8495343.1 hypothetical protein [Burkholderia multivorans]